MRKAKKELDKALELTWVKSDADRREALEMSHGIFTRYTEQVAEAEKRADQGAGELIRIGKIGGRIVTHVWLIEKDMYIGSSLVKTCGLAGVCTHPDHRRKGYALRVVEDSLAFIQRKGDALSLLFSAAHELYRKAGYESAISSLSTTVPNRIAAKVGRGRRLRKTTPNDAAAIRRLYNLCNARRTGAVERNGGDWKRFLRGADWAVLEEKGKIIAYARLGRFWQVRPTELAVTESAASDRGAARALIASLLRRGSSGYLDGLRIFGPPDQVVVREAVMLGGTFGLTDDEYQMLRIVCLDELLRSMSAEFEGRLARSELASKQLSLRLQTDIGTATLRTENGRLFLAEPDMKSAEKPLTVKIPQKLLSQLLMGYRTAQEVAAEDGVRIPAAARRLMEILFPRCHAHFWHADRF